MLLHPDTVDRIKAVRAYVEQPDAAFPPAPGLEGVVLPEPVYGYMPQSLDWWRQRNIDVVTWNAVDMLFSEGAAKYYYADQPQVWARPRGWGRVQALPVCSRDAVLCIAPLLPALQ